MLSATGRLGWNVLWATIGLALAITACPAAEFVDLHADQTDREVVVQIGRIETLRQRYPELSADIQLEGVETVFHVPLNTPAQGSAIIILKSSQAMVESATVELRDAQRVVQRSRVPVSVIELPDPTVPLTGQSAGIEPGEALIDRPTIQQPDLEHAPPLLLATASRVVRLSDLRVPVVAEVNFPLVSANNNCSVSRQTAHPDDPTRRSIYVPLKNQLFGPTGQPSRQMHYLAEIPIDPAWQTSPEAVLTLPPEAIRIHLPQDVGRRGLLLTGEGPGGLGQQVGTTTVDDDGNLYYSGSTDNAVVRFNVAKARFEEPPIDVLALMAKLLPDKSQLPEAFRDDALAWDAIMYVLADGDRLYLAPYRHDVTDDKVTVNGIVSFPLRHWDDAEAFADGMQLLAIGVPGQPRSLYERWPRLDEPVWKIAPLMKVQGVLYTTSYPPPIPMGPWRILEQPEPDQSPVAVVSHDEVLAAGRKRGPRLPTTAINTFNWWDYGVLKTTRAGVKRALTGGPKPATPDPDQMLIYYDPLGAMRLDPAKHAAILESQRGPGLAPCYMATAIPGRPGMVLGVGEYGYYLAHYDLATLDQGFIIKRYLTLDLPGQHLALPVKVGVGPYGRLWWTQGDDLTFLATGYTGVTSMLYSRGGEVLPRHRTRVHVGDNDRINLDSTPSGPSLHDIYPLHGLNDRVHMLASNSASRSGSPYSFGLQTFGMSGAEPLQRRSHLARGASNGWLRGRIVFEPDGRRHQQLIAASGMTAPVYLEMLQGKDLPQSPDAKLLVYDCPDGREPVDVMSASLPVLDGKSGVSGQILSRDGRYLVSLQQGRLLSLDLARWRYVDARRLDLEVWEFTRPDERFNVAPDGGIYLCGREPNAGQATFHELIVSPQGKLSLRPHLTITVDDPSDFKPLEGGVLAFVADARLGKSGSFDLCICPWSRMPGSAMWVIRDFLGGSAAE